MSNNTDTIDAIDASTVPSKSMTSLKRMSILRVAYEVDVIIKEAEKPLSSSSSSSSSILPTELDAVDNVQPGKEVAFLPVPLAYKNTDDVLALRQGRRRRIIMTITPVYGHLYIPVKVIGVLLTEGEHVDVHGNEHVQLLDIIRCKGNSPFVIEARWDSACNNSSLLNTVTSFKRGGYVNMTIAADVMIASVVPMVRFEYTVKVKVERDNSSFLDSIFHDHRVQKRIIPRRVELTLRCCGKSEDSIPKFEVSNVDVSIISSEERQAVTTSISGGGKVEQDATKAVWDEWGSVLSNWERKCSKSIPQSVLSLVRKGIPDTLRGEVWKLLSFCHGNNSDVRSELSLLDHFSTLVLLESPSASCIRGDIQDIHGSGQESLFRLMNSYALYDKDVGYSQGMSYVGALLLLHMPEEQAFSVLVRLMFDFELREFYRDGMAVLRLKTYQLQRLIADELPDLHAHFTTMGVETSMFASQWFLTLFGSKFSLPVVFHVIDVMLVEGTDVLLRVSLHMLRKSKADLLSLQLDGILKYFRVNLPNRYEDKPSLICGAFEDRISSRKLVQYASEFKSIERSEVENNDPLVKAKKEIVSLRDMNVKLESENDCIAKEIVRCNIELMQLRQNADDENECLRMDLETLRHVLASREQENLEERLRTEALVDDMKSSFREQQSERVTASDKDIKECCDGSLPSSSTEDVIADKKRIEYLEEQLAICRLQLAEAECREEKLVNQLERALQDATNSPASSLDYLSEISSDATSLGVADKLSSGVKSVRAWLKRDVNNK